MPQQPPVNVRIEGGQQLEILGRRLAQAGTQGKELRKELKKAFQKAIRQTKLDIKASGVQKMPHEGGMNRRFRTGVGSKTRLTGRNVGVRIVQRNGFDLPSIDKGWIRHPVFGNRKRWVAQKVTPHYFTEPIEEDQDEIHLELFAAMDRIAEKITEGF